MRQTLVWGRDDAGHIVVRANFIGTPFGVPENDVSVDVPGFGPAHLFNVVYRDDADLGRTIETVSLILVDDREGVEAGASPQRTR